MERNTAKIEEFNENFIKIKVMDQKLYCFPIGEKFNFDRN